MVTRISKGPTNANRPGGLKGMLPRRKPMSESDYMEKIKGLEEKVRMLTDRARPTLGADRARPMLGKRPRVQPRKAQPNIPGGMGVPNKRVLQKALTSANINRGKIGEREKLMLERRKKLKDEGYYTVTDKDGNKRVKRK